jgi:hypothetical protein
MMSSAHWQQNEDKGNFRLYMLGVRYDTVAVWEQSFVFGGTGV